MAQQNSDTWWKWFLTHEHENQDLRVDESYRDHLFKPKQEQPEEYALE